MGTLKGLGVALGALAAGALTNRYVKSPEGKPDAISFDKAKEIAKAEGVPDVVQGGKASYNPIDREIVIPAKGGKVSGTAFFHELGHAKVRDFLRRKVHKHAPIAWTAAYAAGQVGVLFPKSTKKRYLAYAPVLIDEAAAHYVGYRLAKKYGVPYRPSVAGAAFSTYALTPAALSSAESFGEKLKKAVLRRLKKK